MCQQQELINLWGINPEECIQKFIDAFDQDRKIHGNTEEALLPLAKHIARCLSGGDNSQDAILNETVIYISRLATAIKAALPPSQGDVSGFGKTYDVLRSATIQAVKTGDELTECARKIVEKIRNPFVNDTDKQFDFWL